MLGSKPLYEKGHMYIKVGTVLLTPVLSIRFRGGKMYNVTRERATVVRCRLRR